MQIEKFFRLIIIITSVVFAPPSLAEISCNSSPDLNCLLRFISQQLKTDSSAPGNQKARIHLQYELDVNGTGIQTNINKKSDAYLRIKSSLDNEDKYISLLKENRFELAIEQSNSIKQPLQDLNSPLPQHLLIEFLTLNLLDEKADGIKRILYSQLIEDKSNLGSVIPKVARYEVLGGAPEKGKRTLENAPIDEFSDTAVYYSKQLTLMLADTSRQLFLEPTSLTNNCSTQTDNLGKSLQSFFSPEQIELLRNIDKAPDEKQSWRAQIDLATLYKNADICPLNITLMTQALIQALAQPDHTRQRHNLDLVFAARSIRRYLN